MALLAGGGAIAGAAMAIDADDEGVQRLEALREQRAHEASQHIAGAARAHAGVAGGIDERAAIRRGDHGACAFERDEGAGLCGQLARDGHAIGLHDFGRGVAEAPHLARMRRQQARAETAFLASISPDGGPDVAHRGGPPGFLELDVAARRLTWTEYVGDGVFKSAGNIRATGMMTLLVPDPDSGDGVELIGRAAYRNVRTGREQRRDALEQHREEFPTQGIMTCEISRAVQ